MIFNTNGCNTEVEKFKIYEKNILIKFKRRIKYFEKVVKQENYELSDREIVSGKNTSAKNLKLVAPVASLYHFARQSRFPWRFYAMFIKMLLERRLSADVRAYTYQVVFGIGDRDLDNPFESGDTTTKLDIHLAQLAETDNRLAGLLSDFLGPVYLEKYNAQLLIQRTLYDGEIHIQRPISLTPRMLTLDESNAINRTSQLSCRNKHTIRMPGPEEVAEQGPDIAFITQVPSLDGKVWKFAVLNPELIELSKPVTPDLQTNLF